MSGGIFIEEILQNKPVNRYFFFKLHTTLCLFVLSWQIILFQILHFFDTEESIDLRPRICFWILPKMHP